MSRRPQHDTAPEDSLTMEQLVARHDAASIGRPTRNIRGPQHRWSVEQIEARRRTGDCLVMVDNWACSYLTIADTNNLCSGEHVPRHMVGAELCLRRYEHDANGELVVAERDPRDGDLFPSTEDAECYALNAGKLQWFRDWRASL